MGEAPLTGSCSGNMLAAHLPALLPTHLSSHHSQRNANTQQTDSKSTLAGSDSEGGHHVYCLLYPLGTLAQAGRAHLPIHRYFG